MYQSTKLIERAFIEHNIPCRAIEQANLSAVLVVFNGKTAKNVMVHFISHADSNDVAVRIPVLATAPEEKFLDVLELINTLNLRFRYIKLALSPKYDIILSCDIPQRTSNLGDVCLELFARIMQIVDELYPELMKLIWS